MAGKVLGIGVVGLTQMVIVTAGGLAATSALNVSTIPSATTTGTVMWALAWYLLGFFLYALPFAAVGALVSRQEDVGGISSPILISIIAALGIGAALLPTQPDSGIVEILSIVPLFAPVLMPMRIALGVAPGWEIALAVALTLLLLGGLTRLTGRIYHNSVLRSGARVRITDALRPS
jgi:ABC-2 type transport system permease protein